MATNKHYEVTETLTEWDDILIKHDIKSWDQCIEEKGLDPEAIKARKAAEKLAAEGIEGPSEDELLDLANTEELDELEEDLYDDTRALAEFRKKRVQEMKEATVKNRFGDLREISKADYISEVTDGSQTCYVVIHLYQDSELGCNLVDEAMLELAPKFKHVKFLKIRSNMAVENWPESRLPAIFVYHKGEMERQIIGLNELGGKMMKAANLEWFLKTEDIVESELECDPVRSFVVDKVKRIGVFKSRGSGLDSDDEFDDDDFR